MGMDRQRSEARIAEVIAEMSVDIVAMQELDLGRRRSAGAHQTRVIAEQLGWYSHFHPAMRRGDEHYGNAIISRYEFNVRRTAKAVCPVTWLSLRIQCSADSQVTGETAFFLPGK